jgi:hypothetical protein
MGKLILLAALVAFAAPASAQVYVQGYTRSDGTYVAPHYRSSPDSSTYNNYSSSGNVNPYTGEVGTRNPAPDPYAYVPYATPHTAPNNGSSYRH